MLRTAALALALLTAPSLAHANTVVTGFQRTGGECEAITNLRQAVDAFAKGPGHHVQHLTGSAAQRFSAPLNFDAPEFYLLIAEDHPEGIIILGDDPGACTYARGFYSYERVAAFLEAAGLEPGKDE